MKLIVILGAQESSKDALVSLLLRGASDLKLSCLQFQNIIEKWEGAASRAAITKKLESQLAAMLKSGKGNVLVNGYVTMDTAIGFIPLLQPDVFDVFRPDMILLVEDQTKLAFRGTRDTQQVLAEQQRLNRVYATVYSAMSGAPLKVMTVNPQHLRTASSELLALMKEVLD